MPRRKFSDAAYHNAASPHDTVTTAMTNRTRLLSAVALMLLAASPLLGFSEEGGAADAGWAPTIARIINFAILAAIIVYYGRGPIGEYLRTRSTTIRKGLVDSKALRADAEKQLADVRQRLSLLPGELADMKRRSEEELAAEKVRLTEAAARERQRLIDQTHREIELQYRVARRDLVEHSVELSISIARARIQKDITPGDQARLIDRYTAGVRA